jgi:hypothetical protein
MAEKVLLSDATDSCGTAADLVVAVDEELADVPLLPQAATTSAALAATAAAATVLVTGSKKTTSLLGGNVRVTGRCRTPHDRSR